VTIPLNDLLVSLKWEEEGAEIPARARAQLLQLANAQAVLQGAAPGGTPGAVLRAGAGRNPFQTEWATTSQILQAMSRDAAKAGGAVTQLTNATIGGARSTGVMRMALTGLAIQATGTSGPVGRLASGLLLFAGGSSLVLGVTAGIAIIATAYQLLTKDTREAAAAQEKLREKLTASAEARRTARTPETEQITLEQEQRRARFAELNALIATRRTQIVGTVGAQRFGFETDDQALQRLLADDKELNDLYRERRQLGQDIRTETVSATDATKKEADELGRAADEARRLKLELMEIRQGAQAIARAGIRGGLTFPTDEAGVPFVSQESLLRGRRRAGAFTPPDFGAGGLGPAIPPLSFANIRRNQPRFVPPDVVGRGVDSLEVAQLVTASLLAGARGGGAGGILGAAGGLASGLSVLPGIGAAAAGPLGWIGFGLQAVSSVFGLFDNKEERRHRELIDALKRMGKEVGLERVMLIFTGPDGHQVRRSLAELEDTDAVERIPGPVGAQG
jgi:hypothetical protein